MNPEIKKTIAMFGSIAVLVGGTIVFKDPEGKVDTRPVSLKNIPEVVLDKNIKNVSCAISAQTITDEKGNRVPQFTWSYTPGANAYIQDVGYLKTPNSNDAEAKIIPDIIIDRPTKYTLKVYTGTATTTCETDTINP